MKQLAQHFIKSPSSYPLTAVYCAGVALAVSVSSGYVTLSIGLLLFTVVTMCAIAYALLNEMRKVRQLLALQREEFAARIDVLMQALMEAGVEIPNYESVKYDPE